MVNMTAKARIAEKCKLALTEMAKEPGNRTCADCGTKSPTWTSCNIGVFVCIRCSGIHRRMGVHISFVKSVSLDSWNMFFFKRFKALGGNLAVNCRYEAKLPKGLKPTISSDSGTVADFITKKYDKKLWYDGNATLSSSKRRSAKRRSSKSPRSSSTSDLKGSKAASKRLKTKRRGGLKRDTLKPATDDSSASDTTVESSKADSKRAKKDALVPDLVDLSQLGATESEDLIDFVSGIGATAPSALLGASTSLPTATSAGLGSGFSFIGSTGSSGRVPPKAPPPPVPSFPFSVAAAAPATATGIGAFGVGVSGGIDASFLSTMPDVPKTKTKDDIMSMYRTQATKETDLFAQIASNPTASAEFLTSMGGTAKATRVDPFATGSRPTYPTTAAPTMVGFTAMTAPTTTAAMGTASIWTAAAPRSGGGMMGSRRKMDAPTVTLVSDPSTFTL